MVCWLEAVRGDASTASALSLPKYQGEWPVPIKLTLRGVKKRPKQERALLSDRKQAQRNRSSQCDPEPRHGL